MSFATFLEPGHLMQTVVLALSIFNMVAFFWLAMTVWLNGDRRAWIARLGVIGLGLSALFFFLHALLISGPLTSSSNAFGLVTPDLLWHLIWIPALGVPYIWFAIGLHYASLINEGWRRRRPVLLLSSGLLGCVIMLLLILNQSTFTFVGTLSLLVYPDPLSREAGLFSPVILILTLFLCYVTFCAIGPWFTFRRVVRLLGVLWNAGRHWVKVHIGGSDEGANQSVGGTRADKSAVGAINRPLRRMAVGEELKGYPQGIPLQQAALHRTLQRALVDAFWDDPTDVEQLQEPDLSWHLARPWLLLAALLMVGLTTTLGVLCIESMFDWLMGGKTSAAGTIYRLHPVLSSIPLHLFVLDLVATGAVAFIILLIGYSIVRHGILIERPLARRGFLEQWRGIVIVATGVAIFIALLVSFTRSNLGGLLLITLLATGAYSLFTWSSYTAHDHYIALLGPFLRSTSLRHWLNTDLQKTEQELENLFFHLCREVLAVECARLVIIAGSIRRSFSYRWPGDAEMGNVGEIGEVGDGRLPIYETGFSLGASHPGSEENGRHPQGALPLPPTTPASTGIEKPFKVPTNARRVGQGMGVDAHRVQVSVRGQPMVCWVFPIYDERGLVATLYLGPREDGGAFTDEDMDLAHACGQRILDTLGDHEAMQAVAGLLRRRIVDVKLLGAQQRRVLHDEILPQMHLALLRLEMVRSMLRGRGMDSEKVAEGGEMHSGGEVGVKEGDILAVGNAEANQAAMGTINRPLREAMQKSSRGDVWKEEQALDEAVEMIVGAHRRLAAMMRATATGAPHRLERDGLMRAIHTMLEQDFQHAFDEVEWYVSDETAAYIDEVTPPAIAELIFAAVQEALRNAARHARGHDVHRRLRLVLKASYSCVDAGRSHIEVVVADDGVGIASTSAGETTGTGSGLLTHSALLAIAGGSLTIKSTPGHGVTVRILLPVE